MPSLIVVSWGSFRNCLVKARQRRNLTEARYGCEEGKFMTIFFSESFKTTHERKLRQIREQPRDRNASCISSRRS